MNIQKGEICRACMWEEAWGFQALSGHITFPAFPCVYQHRSSANLWNFVEASSCRPDPLLTPFSALLPFHEKGGRKPENSKPLIMAWSFW